MSLMSGTEAPTPKSRQRCHVSRWSQRLLEARIHSTREFCPEKGSLQPLFGPTLKRFRIIPGLSKANVREEHGSTVWSLMNIYNKLCCFVFGFTWDFIPELHQHPRKSSVLLRSKEITAARMSQELQVNSPLLSHLETGVLLPSRLNQDLSPPAQLQLIISLYFKWFVDQQAGQSGGRRPHLLPGQPGSRGDEAEPGLLQDDGRS